MNKFNQGPCHLCGATTNKCADVTKCNNLKKSNFRESAGHVPKPEIKAK